MTTLDGPRSTCLQSGLEIGLCPRGSFKSMPHRVSPDAATGVQFVVDHLARKSKSWLTWELPSALDAHLVAAKLKQHAGPFKLATVVHRVAVLSAGHSTRTDSLCSGGSSGPGPTGICGALPAIWLRDRGGRQKFRPPRPDGDDRTPAVAGVIGDYRRARPETSDDVPKGACKDAVIRSDDPTKDVP